MTTAAEVATAPTGGAVDWLECLVPRVDEPPLLRAEIRQQMGAVPAWLARVAPCPWLARAIARGTSYRPAHIDAQLWRFIGLVVSQDNSCRYCYGIQRALFKIYGYRDELIAELERDFHTAAIAPRDRVALAFARKISRADPRPGAADRGELTRAGFSDAAVAEIAFAAALAAFMNRVATFLALPPEPLESIVDRRFFRLVRPFLARMVRMPDPVSPPTAPVRNEGPCAAVVAALEGTPAAAMLRAIIDDAWASPVLPRRTKSLILAVTARCLGCSRGEADAAEALAAEGVPPEVTADVLRHLGSPLLDARDGRLIVLARESVRYQPALIQRRMREATVAMAGAEILDAIGVLALANAVCRLSVLLEVC